MSLTSPNLDDRTFEQLVLDARARVTASCPEWTDLSPHDPGVVLLELFAHMTETMLFRLNRLPEKAYVELLRLIGVQRQPPAAASTRLVFRLERPAAARVEIPRGTRVTTQRSDRGAAPVFSTAEVVRFEPGEQEAAVQAFHAEMVEAELVGRGTGAAGLTLALKRPPVVAPTGDPLDLVVGVEVPAEELADRTPKRIHEGKHFRLWREVEGFTDYGDDEHVFVADRIAGRISFAPAAQRLGEKGELSASPRALAAVPPLGREVRVWYRRGGGPEGNVAPGLLTVLKDPVAGAALKVVNPSPATGGRGEESLANALVRGREEFHSLRRALTARDYETIALRSASGIARARAMSQAQLWSHAAPGTVEVTLVPSLPDAQRGADDRGVTEVSLVAQQTDEARRQIQALLDDRRPLGATCRVTWARYKTVSVRAKVFAHHAEDVAQLKERIEARLYRTICPLPPPSADAGAGWRFGQPLSVFSVYNAVLAEPGVKNVEGVELVVSRVPGPTRALAVDAAAPRVVYAGCGTDVFRSLDEGEGWEPIGSFTDEDVDNVEVHPERPGLVAVASRVGADAKRSRLRVSFESGETWAPSTQTLDTSIEDLAWVTRDGEPVLLIATAGGLFELSTKKGATPLPVVVDAANPKLGIYAVAASSDSRGNSVVAVAAMSSRGVFLSTSGGQRDSFRSIGLTNEDARVVEIQRDGARTFVWAGVFASSGTDTGSGARSFELVGNNAAWKSFDRNWEGGSCLALTFVGSTVFAGTHRAGVLWCDSNKPDAQWRRPDVDSRLPLRTAERLFQPVHALAALPQGTVFAGGPKGVFRTKTGERYDECSRQSFDQKVTLAPTWLFASGKHDIEVVHDETARD